MTHPSVLRYDEHMPQTDDVTLIALKGHLLVEEVLVQLGETVLSQPQYLRDANLSFHKLACVVRAASGYRSDDSAWQLILSLNSFRNDLAHNLDSSKRQDRLNELFKIDEQVQPVLGMPLDRTDDASLSESERLRYVVIDCMEFLMQVISDILFIQTFGYPAPSKKHPPK
jgi:hypothetical protein